MSLGRHMRYLAAVESLALALAFVHPLGACPVCDTGTGRQVRAGVFDAEFGRTLVAVLLPFPILLAVVAVIHFGWPPLRGRGEATGEGDARHDRDDPEGN